MKRSAGLSRRSLIRYGAAGAAAAALPLRAPAAPLAPPAALRVRGLPVGLSFFAGPWSEPRILSYACAFEQATRHRRLPRFLTTDALGPS